ncbi:putative quinol monooxygenase [Catalinimonas alkaloidigena]|nr:putative quinol monooxygenase [Catalinimonas alkaloidigena]
MKLLKLGFFVLGFALWLTSCHEKGRAQGTVDTDAMMIRIAELTIDSTYLDEYLAILKEESAASVRVEPGVIAIYPMFEQENPTEIRILEIYASREAYEAHLQTPHFQHYKTTTLHMVKDLRLIEMAAIDEATMPQVFRKLNP